MVIRQAGSSLVSRQRGTIQEIYSFVNSQMCHAKPAATPKTASVCIANAQRSADATVIAHATGQTMFKCPELVPAQAEQPVRSV
eukprot:6179765-Pleurochrysis_carterae.AAC.1